MSKPHYFCSSYCQSTIFPAAHRTSLKRPHRQLPPFLKWYALDVGLKFHPYNNSVETSWVKPRFCLEFLYLGVHMAIPPIIAKNKGNRIVQNAFDVQLLILHPKWCSSAPCR